MNVTTNHHISKNIGVANTNDIKNVMVITLIALKQ